MSTKAMIHLGDDAPGNLKRVRASGASVLAQYGASVLVRGDAAQLKQLADGGLRVRELAEAPPVDIGGFSVDTAAPVLRSASATAVVDAQGQSRQVVRVAGPMHPDWKTALERLGVRLHQALTEDSYLASMAGDLVDDVQALDFVESVVAYQPALKVNAALLQPGAVTALAPSAGLTLTAPPAPAAAAPWRARRPRRREWVATSN
ncbi:hypothetical protein [Ideonella sp. A 288]|uniref:hypothetical protein n=1 Tax=Ideonella sp. A 288 TaxID=1962181 RepID=UPI000B4B1AD8|nr:hypothetical protein [Ideonella sp. A 288]